MSVSVRSSVLPMGVRYSRGALPASCRRPPMTGGLRRTTRRRPDPRGISHLLSAWRLPVPAASPQLHGTHCTTALRVHMAAVTKKLLCRLCHRLRQPAT